MRSIESEPCAQFVNVYITVLVFRGSRLYKQIRVNQSSFSFVFGKGVLEETNVINRRSLIAVA